MADPRQRQIRRLAVEVGEGAAFDLLASVGQLAGEGDVLRRPPGADGDEEGRAVGREVVAARRGELQPRPHLAEAVEEDRQQAEGVVADEPGGGRTGGGAEQEAVLRHRRGDAGVGERRAHPVELGRAQEEEGAGQDLVDQGDRIGQPVLHAAHLGEGVIAGA